MKSLFYILRICLIAGIFIILQPAHAHGDPTLPAIQNIEFVTVGSDGTPSNDDSFSGFPSYDGRFITFMSWDDGWFPEGDLNQTNCENHCFDVFLRDRLNNTTIKVSNGLDNQNTADDGSLEPILSGDGRYLVFDSYAGNLVPNDDNGDSLFIDDGLDTFIYDRQLNTLDRYSVRQDGSEIDGNSNAAMVSGDGKVLFFASMGEDVIPGVPVASHNVYRRDAATWAIESIISTIDGQPLNEQSLNFSTDETGRYLAFSSHASNIVAGDVNEINDTFLYDHQTGVTVALSRGLNGGTGNGASGFARISYDGSLVVFRSEASDLVPGDTNGVADIFMYEVATGNISLISTGFDGSPANGPSRDPSICEFGRFISYTSDATNIVPDDTNGLRDAFVVDMELGEIRTIAVTNAGNPTNGDIQKTIVFPNCQGVVYASDATNILSNDNNGFRDIFAADLIYPANLFSSRLTATPLYHPHPTHCLHNSCHQQRGRNNQLQLNQSSTRLRYPCAQQHHRWRNLQQQPKPHRMERHNPRPNDLNRRIRLGLRPTTQPQRLHHCHQQCHPQLAHPCGDPFRHRCFQHSHTYLFACYF